MWFTIFNSTGFSILMGMFAAAATMNDFVLLIYLCLVGSVLQGLLATHLKGKL